MKSYFFAANNCIDFVKDLIIQTSTNLVKDIEDFIENGDKEQIGNFLKVLQSEFYKRPYVKKFSYHTQNYGYEFHGSMKIEKNLFIIDLFDMVRSYLQDPILKGFLETNYCSANPQIMKSFFDGSFYKNSTKSNLKVLYLAIYGDEINVVNPIGTFSCYRN